MYIYLTTNEVNGKMYIGMTTREDKNYLGSGKNLKRAIKKYGKENFTTKILEECSTFEELCEREEYWINHLNAKDNPNFYNIIDGGMGGNSESLKEYWSNMSKEERKKCRNWNPHFRRNPPVGEKNPMWGKSTSEYVKEAWNNRTEKERKKIAEKVSETRINLGSAKGENNPMYGRSAIREQNLNWYTDGETTIYRKEGTQPNGYKLG